MSVINKNCIIDVTINPLVLKSGIDGQPESPQVGHSWSANKAQHLNSSDYR